MMHSGIKEMVFQTIEQAELNFYFISGTTVLIANIQEIEFYQKAQLLKPFIKRTNHVDYLRL